jgi:signal transduction histidine kinase
LGLAISFGIIKEHNGTISVESEIDKGTTFIVRLPVTAEEESTKNE